MPDLMITNSHRYWNGLAIELKNTGGTGVVSDKQKETLSAYENEGWKTMVSDNFVDCIFEIQRYDLDITKICKMCRKIFKTEKTLKSHMKRFH